MKKVITLVLAFLLLSTLTTYAEVSQQEILNKITTQVQSRLNKLDKDVSEAALQMAKTGTNTAEKSRILSDLCKTGSFIVDCLLINPDGKIELIEPDDFKVFEGDDANNQEQFIRAKKTNKPVISHLIKAIEAFDGFDLEHPVQSSSCTFAGSVSAFFEPKKMFIEIIDPLLKDTNLHCSVMQKDGVLLYESSQQNIGRNVFTDSRFTSNPIFQSIMKKVAESKEGTETFGDTKDPKYQFVTSWKTVTLYDAEWRIIVSGMAPAI